MAPLADEFIEQTKSRGVDGISAVELTKAKTAQDFHLSLIHSIETFHQGCEQYEDTLVSLAKRFPTKRKLLDFASICDRSWLASTLGETQASITAGYFQLTEKGRFGYPVAFSEYVDVINEYCQRRGRRISVNCECIEPAALAALRSIKGGILDANLNLKPIDLDIHWRDTSGVYQTQSTADLASTDDYYDFVVTPVGPFALTGVLENNLLDYYCAFPVHRELQVMLQKKVTLRQLHRAFGKTRRIHLFRSSSSEEQYLRTKGKYRGFEVREYDRYESLLTMFNSLAPRDLVNAWEPLASVLWKSGSAARVPDEDPYFHVISFFQHRHWGTPEEHSGDDTEAVKVGRLFKKIFIFEWNRMRRNIDTATIHLTTDSEFLEYFSKGSGLSLPNELAAADWLSN